MLTLKRYKEEALKDPALAKAYEEQQPETEALRAALDAKESEKTDDPKALPEQNSH